MMSLKELGLDTFVKYDEDIQKKYILAGDTGKEVKYYLEDPPLCHKKGIVTRGTLCYRAWASTSETQSPEYVVKFSWPEATKNNEGELLKLAKEKGVKGISEHVWDGNIEGADIKNFRPNMSGARLSPLWAKQCEKSTKPGNASPDLPNTSNQKQRKPTSERQKRKGDASNSQPSKRQKTTLIEQETSFINRVQRILITRPAGESLQKFQTVTELLEVIRDTINGHKSLLLKGDILHRDISNQNMIIHRDGQAGDKGRLSDLDMATKDISHGEIRSGICQLTGTVHFMARGVL